MNIIARAHQAYAPKTSALRNGRSAETQLLSEVTIQLRQTAKYAKTAFPQFAEALHANRAVWTHFAAQVADGDNELPDDLRARIFYLAEFTNFHSRKVLNGEADIEPLIDINTAVMRGLTSSEGN